MHEEPALSTVNYSFYSPEYLTPHETPDNKLDPAKNFSVKRLRNVISLKNQLAPVCHRLLDHVRVINMVDLEDSLDHLASSLHSAVAENFEALGEFAYDLEDGQKDIETYKVEVAQIRQLEANLEAARKNNVVMYKAALDNLANKTKLIDVFNLASVAPPAEGASFFHKIFSWCTEILYESPSTLYSWENFKEQCFMQDYGVDFIMRLRGVNIPKLTNYQYTITKALLRYDAFLRTSIHNTDFHKVLDCVTFIIDAYEARDGFIQAREAHRLGVDLHRSADVAIKVDRNLKTKLSDFITYSLSVQNTLNDT
jgi:hypothetical protein